VTRIAIHQPNYFPWLGYFAKIARADVFVLLDDVRFQRGNATSITNRTKVKTRQGPQWLTVPVTRGGSSLIRDVTIDYQRNWVKKHLDTLRFTYARSPFFSEVHGLVEETLAHRPEGLATLNELGIRAVCGLLTIATPIVLSSSLGLDAGDKNLRIVEICRALGATVYLSGAGARRYNDEAMFAAHGVALEYNRFEHPVYPQLHGPFVPGLSALDALFNRGPGLAELLA
jgi:hypothetical protein